MLETKPSEGSVQGAGVVKISHLAAQNLPKVGWNKRAGKYYLRISLIDDGQGAPVTNQTRVSQRSTSPVWEESLYYDYITGAILELELYVDHSVRSAELISTFRENVDTLIERANNGKVTCDLTQSAQVMFDIELTASKSELGAAATALSEAVPMAVEASSNFKDMSSLTGKAADGVSNVEDGINNIMSFNDTWSPLLEKVALFSSIVDEIAEIHPYAKMAWSVLSLAHKAILAQRARDDKIRSLLETMSDTYSFVHDAEPLGKVEMLKGTVLLMAQQTTECAYFIRDYAKDSSFWVRSIKNAISVVDDRIQSYEAKFREIQQAFHLRAALHTDITVMRVMDRIESTAVEIVLDDMPYAQGARYNVEKGCLPGTRTVIVDEIVTWVNGALEDSAQNDRRILLLSGVAGSGKSAIAHTVARHFDQIGRLGASYCFSRDRQSQLRPNNFFSTLSRDLADLDPQWKAALWRIVDGNRALRTTHVVQEQFEQFLVKPATGLTSVGPVVLVIDALDESGDISTRRTLLGVLAKRITELPPHFRVIITCRPEQDIQRLLFNNPIVYYKSMDEISRESTVKDITAFIEHEMKDVHELEEQWSNKEWLKMLVEKSEGLFQWAFIVCLFINGDNEGGLDPVEQMEILMSSSVTDLHTKLAYSDSAYLSD